MRLSRIIAPKRLKNSRKTTKGRIIMITERLEICSGEYDKSVMRASELLKKGGVVAIPTETVYGLAAIADNDDAITDIFKAKGRPQDNPLIVHISDMEMLKKVARDIPPAAYECAKHFWPGPFTMVLKRGEWVSDNVCAGLDTVAVRMPSDLVALDIIRAAGPLAAPSANTSGKPSPTSAKHVLDDLDGKIDAVVMAKNCEVGLESTVITLATEKPRLLRPGAVTPEQLKAVLHDIEVDKAVLAQPESGEKVASPGMKYKHYAPATEAYLVEGNEKDFTDFVNDIEDRVAVCFEREEDKVASPKICYGDGDNETTLAHELFDVLRSVDALGASRVYIHAPSKSGVGLAVYNRLIRATGFKVIKL